MTTVFLPIVGNPIQGNGEGNGMDLQNYCLGVDVWEGALDIDEVLLKSGGVSFITIRINDTAGGLHMDTGFAAQWAQAAGFARAPYYVHTPWATPEQNFAFLSANVPASVKRVFIDKELQRNDQDASREAGDFETFLRLCEARWDVTIYTGGWFAPYLSAWPARFDYWWARYPYALYPTNTTTISWDALKAKLAALVWSPGAAPGPVKIWQCSGDRFILPGTAGRPMDINIFNGTADQLRAYFAEDVPTPPPAPAPSDAEKLARLWGYAVKQGWPI